MRERKLMENDRVYIDDTNVIYKIAGIQYSGNKILCISVYYVDPITKEEATISVNPELVKPFQITNMP